MKNTRQPTKITLDAYAASHRAVREMKETGELQGQHVGNVECGAGRLTHCEHSRRKSPANLDPDSSCTRAHRQY